MQVRVGFGAGVWFGELGPVLGVGVGRDPAGAVGDEPPPVPVTAPPLAGADGPGELDPLLPGSGFLPFAEAEGDADFETFGAPAVPPPEAPPTGRAVPPSPVPGDAVAAPSAAAPASADRGLEKPGRPGASTPSSARLSPPAASANPAVISSVRRLRLR